MIVCGCLRVTPMSHPVLQFYCVYVYVPNDVTACFNGQNDENDGKNLPHSDIVTQESVMFKLQRTSSGFILSARLYIPLSVSLLVLMKHFFHASLAAHRQRPQTLTHMYLYTALALSLSSLALAPSTVFT